MPAKATPGRHARINPYIARQELQSAADACSRQAAISTAHIPRRNRELSLQCIDLLHQRFPGKPWVNRVTAQLLRDDAFLQSNWGPE